MATSGLTHEVGAGAPCLKCGDKCPGLDLHFWRKNCRNCKCKQEDHDVIKSVSTRGIDNIGKLLMQDKGEEYKKPTPKAESPAHSPKKEPPPVKTKVAAPPPAPKPAKNQTPSAPASAPSTAAQPQNVNVTLDFGGKQHSLDFGIPLPDEAFPAPPTQQQKSFESPIDLPSPPPVAEEKPPAVPPLPQEFQQTVTISKPPPEQKSEEVLPPPPPETQQLQDEKIPTPSSESAEYEWKPPTSNQKLIESYIDSLPQDKKPITGTEGAQYRKKQLMRQLPAHDQEPGQCHDLTPQEAEEMQLFVKRYKEKALGVANVEEENKPKNCVECKEQLKVGEPIIWAERAGSDKHWHPKCFVCCVCKELLVDLIYFFNEDKIYCGRHYCEVHKPRCSACDELIFAPEYTQAEDSFWHLKHFCCWHCDIPLGGQNYVPQNSQPVCIPCYEKEFAHTCTACGEIIAPNTEWVTFEKYHWHAQPECFKCSQCGESLVGKPCIPKENMVFCSSKCKKEKLAAISA